MIVHFEVLFKKRFSEYADLFTDVVVRKTKGRISKRVLQGKQRNQISRKKIYSYSLKRIRACAYQGVKNVRLLRNLACFVYL